jgi:CRP-like cAMP-binding protein
VRLELAGKETILATLGPGEFFGDISLFDHGPRSADVVANVDSVVARVSARTVDELSRKAPDLAAPFLRAVGKTLTSRIRADNKRYGDAMRFNRAAR